MKQQLIVEGSNDAHVISNILTKNDYDYPEGFTEKTFKNKFYKSANTVTRVPLLLEEALNNSGIDNIGVIIDANQVGVAKRYEALLEKVKAKPGFVMPEGFPDEGLVVRNDSTNQNLGIWIMPNNTDNGYMEHFLADLIKDEDSKVYKKAKDSVDSFCLTGFSKIKESSKQKSYVYTYLAWQKEPGKPLGQAINANYIDSREGAEKLIAWLTKVFDIKKMTEQKA